MITMIRETKTVTFEILQIMTLYITFYKRNKNNVVITWTKHHPILYRVFVRNLYLGSFKLPRSTFCSVNNVFVNTDSKTIRTGMITILTLSLIDTFFDYHQIRYIKVATY